MIETMATAIVKNIGHELRGEEPQKTGAAFVAIPQIPPRNVTWFKKGKWVHQAKIKGNTDSVFEVFILKALGIKKLE